ncbi:MAG: FGGY-family carbohydrate kinase [Pusillimonas sp.]
MPDVEDSAVLALDLGSTWLKAAWVRPGGRLGGIERVASPLRAQGLDAEEIWRAVRDLLAGLCRASDAPKNVLALALTGVTRTHVFVDMNGRPLAPVVLWNDPYGEQQGARVARAFGADPDTPGYGAFHPLARLVQFVDDRSCAPYAMVELKDWLNFRLSGRWATDAISFGRIAPGSIDLGLADVLARLGLPASVIPACALPTRILGPVRADSPELPAALGGVPLAVCGFDTWASSLGMGAVVDGGVYDISGTTQVMGVFSRSRREVQGMVSIAWTEDLWQLGGPCQTGLGTLAWFARSFLDVDDPAATLAAAAESRGGDVPLCLPYLSGERMPLWSSTLSGSFQHVKPQHTRSDFAQSLVEGLVLAHRLALDAMGARRPGVAIHMDGGGAQHRYWVQARADAFGMPVKTSGSGESALVGAALAAEIGLGRYRDIGAAQLQINQSSALVVPRPERSAYFESRAKEFSGMLSRDMSSI